MSSVSEAKSLLPTNQNGSPMSGSPSVSRRRAAAKIGNAASQAMRGAESMDAGWNPKEESKKPLRHRTQSAPPQRTQEQWLAIMHAKKEKKKGGAQEINADELADGEIPANYSPTINVRDGTDSPLPKEVVHAVHNPPPLSTSTAIYVPEKTKPDRTEDQGGGLEKQPTAETPLLDGTPRLKIEEEPQSKRFFCWCWPKSN